MKNDVFLDKKNGVNPSQRDNYLTFAKTQKR